MREANVTGKFQLPLEPRHGCETTNLPSLTLTVTLCQKHGGGKVFLYCCTASFYGFIK